VKRPPAPSLVAKNALLLTACAAVLAAQATRKDIVYDRVADRDLLLDLYLPPGDGPHPLVVWVHGGGWRRGSKANPQAVWLTGHGYAVASIAYRLSDVAKFPAQIEDAKSAVRFLRANARNYGIDAEHIGAWGASAGGHLVALLGVTGDLPFFEPRPGARAVSSRVQAVVDYFGPTDLLAMSRFPSSIPHDAPDSPESLLIGGPIQEHKEKTVRANPIRYVTADDAPFLIVHGDKDMSVPLNQSELLYAALRKAGVPAQLRVLKDAGHGGPAFQDAELKQSILAFLDEHLKRHAK
jgi:acetyl esterase/lipase